jgi:3'-5' exoribonuclease
MFPEALMLHYLDDLDSKMESMRAHFEREAENESSWTTYNPSLGRTLLNTAKFLNQDQPAPAAPPAASSSGEPSPEPDASEPEPVSVASPETSVAVGDHKG